VATIITATRDGREAPAVAVPAALARPAVELACRVLDVVLATLVLVVLLPLLLLIAAAIRVDSPGPVVFRQQRLGRSLAPFTLNKFRTMRQGVTHDIHREFVLGLIAGDRPSATDGGPQFKLNRDPRITRVGRLLRRSSLDELPQLWNVILGHMSLVGPRPPIPYEVEKYPSHWFGRFAVKPGVTGLWQVGGRSEVTLEEMIKLDLDYVMRRSFWLNLKIIARTVPVVLSTRGAS
jgi:lipopolysaccharide/colanic/teichoic acid biosynthesis glycosyltransferase